MKSQRQSESMVRWFFAQGTKRIDIHIRKPVKEQAQYKNDSDWIWITQHEGLDERKTLQLLPWCRYQNIRGSDIFVRPHRYHSQNLIFLDDLDVPKARKVGRKYSAMIVETSPDNTQMWVRIEEQADEFRRKEIQQHLAFLGYTDPGSVSGEHLGRLCGFRSQKNKCWVNLRDTTHADIYRPPPLNQPSLPQGGACAKTKEKKKSQSERDFSWVLKESRKGIQKERLLAELVQKSKARGKPSPEKYATRTIKKALEVLNKGRI